jgi:hypothetical protein
MVAKQPEDLLLVARDTKAGPPLEEFTLRSESDEGLASG